MAEIAANLFESILFVIFLTLFLNPKKEKRVFFCWASVSRRLEKEREVQQLNDMIEIQKQSLENYVAGERELHRQRHELEHKFYSIQYLLEQDWISEGMEIFRETIDGLYGNARNMTISGNIIETVISNKEKKYASSHIDLKKRLRSAVKKSWIWWICAFWSEIWSKMPWRRPIRVRPKK